MSLPDEIVLAQRIAWESPRLRNLRHLMSPGMLKSTMDAQQRYYAALVDIARGHDKPKERAEQALKGRDL